MSANQSPRDVQAMMEPPLTSSASSFHHFIPVESDAKPSTSPSDLGAAPRVTLQWSRLALRATVKNPQTKQVEEKTILNNVTGSARPGELLVIMGPSGAGKSSLLDCISGRNRAVEGQIVVNGQPWTKATKRLASYVMQDDLFYPTITVQEHLMYQAKLRMGSRFTEAQSMQRVEDVMEELGLMKCRHTLIGGEALRGISGGERKRLSFATEILTNPSILFVDEPTSGLDSFMAETVVRQLQQIARDGRTVVATIHQPSSEIFQLFDQLYLLSDGSPVFHGKASASMSYFASLGYSCPTFINPSDYFMRQLVVVDKNTDEAGVARIEALKAAWLKCQQAPQLDHVAVGEVSKFSEVEFDSRLSLIGQISVLANRNVVRFVRDRIAFRVAILQTLIVGVLVGLIYLQLDLDQGGIQNFLGGFFFLMVQHLFGPSNSTMISVPMELPIVIREYKANLYHLLSWYIAKNLSELPMQIIQPIVGFIPVYFLMGIGHGFDVFLAMQIILILINSSAVGLGYLVACLIRREDIAPMVGIIVVLMFLLFGGLFINPDDCPVYFVWVEYISPVKYGFGALMKIYWDDVPSIPCDTTVESCIATSGAQVLKSYSVGSLSVVADGLMIVLLNVCFRVVAFIGLMMGLRSKK